MHETTNRDPTTDPNAGEPVQATADGLAVEKVAASRGDEAVVVNLAIRSERDERSLVRIVDELPPAVAGNVVEFHPAYDPEHWSKGHGEVVYEATLEPHAERRTVYGVGVEDHTQRDLFLTAPNVESVVLGDPADDGTRLGSARAGTATDLARPDGSGTTTADGDGSGAFSFGGAGATNGATSSGAGPGPTTAPPGPGADGSVVEALVRELNRRELTPSEQAAIREAVGLDEAPAVTRLRSRLDDLARDVDTQSTAVDALTADVADLDEAVEQERRWRDDFRRLLSERPDEP